MAFVTMNGATFIVVVGVGATEQEVRKALEEANIDTDGLQFQLAENGKVESVRNIIEEASQILPSLPKIFVLDGDELTVQAQNALLKIAEEPPRHCKLVVTITDYRKLLPTIISRARVIRGCSPALIGLGTESHLVLARKVYDNIGVASAVNLYNILNKVEKEQLKDFLAALCLAWERGKGISLEELKIISKYKNSARKSTNYERHIKTMLQELRGVRVNARL